MKRLALAFSLLLILLLYTFFSEQYILDFCQKADLILQESALLIADKKYSQAEDAVSKLYDIWEEKDVIMSVFLGDECVVEPQKSVVAILTSFEDKNYKECLISIRECQGYVHEIIENNRTSLGNVL